MTESVLATTKAILDARAVSFQLIRDAYIELHGVPCRWFRAVEGTARKDFYGDIRSPELVREQVPGGLRVVLVLNDEQLKMLSTFPGSVTEDYGANIVGMVKVRDQVQEGDRFSFEFRYFVPGSTDIKYVEVARVEGSNNVNPIHKQVFLMPAHDLNAGGAA